MSVSVCEEDVHKKERKEREMKREMKMKRLKKKKHKLIHPDKQTARQQDKSRQDKSR